MPEAGDCLNASEVVGPEGGVRAAVALAEGDDHVSIAVADELPDHLLGDVRADVLPVVVTGFVRCFLNVLPLRVENSQLFGVDGLEHQLQEVFTLLLLFGPARSQLLLRELELEGGEVGHRGRNPRALFGEAAVGGCG